MDLIKKKVKEMLSSTITCPEKGCTQTSAPITHSENHKDKSKLGFSGFMRWKYCFMIRDIFITFPTLFRRLYFDGLSNFLHPTVVGAISLFIVFFGFSDSVLNRMKNGEIIEQQMVTGKGQRLRRKSQ